MYLEAKDMGLCYKLSAGGLYSVFITISHEKKKLALIEMPSNKELLSYSISDVAKSQITAKDYLEIVKTAMLAQRFGFDKQQTEQTSRDVSEYIDSPPSVSHKYVWRHIFGEASPIINIGNRANTEGKKPDYTLVQKIIEEPVYSSDNQKIRNTRDLYLQIKFTESQQTIEPVRANSARVHQ